MEFNFYNLLFRTFAVEFCGYFPTDNPKYSIIVSINKAGLPASGELMAGDVFKKIVGLLFPC